MFVVNEEYKEAKKVISIISAITFLVIFYDIFVHDAQNVIQFAIIKLLFIASFFLPIQLLKFSRAKDYAAPLTMIVFFLYSHYYMTTLHYSYYTAYIEFFMAGPLCLRFKRKHFLITYSFGLVLMVWGTLQLKGSTGNQSLTEDALQTAIPVWLFSIFWFFSIIKIREKMALQEKKFAELGKTTSFLLHEIQSPLNRLKDSHHIEKERIQEIDQLNNILNISQAISAGKIESLENKTFLISESIHNQIDKYDKQISASEIKIETQLETCDINSNRELFNILINNLLKNAIEYLHSQKDEKNKIISISGEIKKTHYYFSISNNFSTKF